MNTDHNPPDVFGGDGTAPAEDVDVFLMLDERSVESPAESPDPDEIPPDPEKVRHDGVSARDEGSAVGAISGKDNSTALRDLDQSRDKRINSPDIYLYPPEGLERLLEVARSADPEARRREWDAEALRRSAENYVVPPGLLTPVPPQESAYRVLTSRRVLAIAAPNDHAGHEAAALRLAHELRKESAADLVVCEELVDRDFRLDAKALLYENRPAVVVLDLRDALDVAIDRVCNGLVSFTEGLASRNSYLVILVPHGRWSRFDAEFPGRVHELARPSASEVLLRHLTDVDDPAALLDQPPLAEKLTDAWPPEAARLAGWVSEAAEAGYVGPAELAEQACGAAEDWTVTLRGEVEAHQQPDGSNVEWLSLLLAAALLEGAQPQQIVAASDRLLRRLGHEPPDAQSLLRPGVGSTLRRIRGASFDVRTRHFERPRYGASVLRYFWSEHPMLQRPLRNWMAELRVGGLHRRDLERVADRTTELARVTGPRVAIDLARRWSATEHGSTSTEATSDSRFDRSRRSIAVRLLTNTALDPKTGRHVRDQLYNWAHQRTTSADLDMVVAEVCGGEMSVEFPRVALTRLKHLAASENAMVRRSVVSALRGIGEHMGLCGFLRYVEEWFDRPEPARLATLTEAVESIVGAAFDGDVPVDSVGTASARSFWARVLDDMPLEESRRMVAAWLKPAAYSGAAEHRVPMVEALVAATEQQPTRIQRLYYASRIAALPPESTVDADSDPLGGIVRQVWTRLDEVDPLRT